MLKILHYYVIYSSMLHLFPNFAFNVPVILIVIGNIDNCVAINNGMAILKSAETTMDEFARQQTRRLQLHNTFCADKVYTSEF